MGARRLLLLTVVLTLGLAGSAAAAGPTAGECTEGERSGPSRCLYRSMLPSAGLVAECKTAADCRVGYYYGDPGRATWFDPPKGGATLPKPEVIWRTATLAEARFDGGAPGAVSYFFEARRHLLSPPRWHVLAVDPARLLLAAAEERALVIRQLFSGREVARLERPWAPARWLGDAITSLRFDPDGRLTFTWLRGSERALVTERISIPPVPR